MKLKIVSLIWLISFFSVLTVSAAGKKGQLTTIQSFSYTPRSVSKTTLAGIKLSRGINFSVISEVGGVMAGNPSSVPLDFIINIDVKNPNNQTVIMSEYEYILRIDNVEFARGTVRKPFKLGKGKKKSLPLPIHIDLVSFLRGSNSGTIQNMIRNFMGSGARPSNIMLQIKPTYQAGKQTFVAPRYIPVGFSLEAKKN